MTDFASIAPGDVLVTSSGKLAGFLIKLGALLTGKPALHNHVVVAHHTDDAGTFWGIEAAAGGVGWVDLKLYEGKRWLRTNAGQPKTDAQRAKICETVEGMLGTPYDWSAIVKLGMDAIHAPDLWHRYVRPSNPREDVVPTHVICSALADWVYQHVGLDSPRKGRWTTPGDWFIFLEDHGWS